MEIFCVHIDYITIVSAGKKKQKMKGKTLALTEFLTDEKGSAGPGPSYVLSNKPLDWASEMENLAVSDGMYGLFLVVQVRSGQV